jgi:1-acyl-sn-glycerol-3-phosphate acyltransferase
VFAIWIVPTWLIVTLISDRVAAGRFTSSACKALLALVGCPVRVVGREFMNTPGAKMYAANHASYFDVVPLMAGLGVPYQFVAKMEVHQMWFIGTFLRQMKHLSFKRENANSRLQQVEEMERILQRGDSVFVFPEGTFTREDGIRHFQLGAFKAALSARVPIIPVSVAGTRKFLRDGTYLPRPSSITITLSPPMYPEAPSAKHNAEEGSEWHELIRLRDETRAAIARHAAEPLL